MFIYLFFLMELEYNVGTESDPHLDTFQLNVIYPNTYQIRKQNSTDLKFRGL